MYKEHLSSCEDISANTFPVKQIHKIGILDIRIANTDRNEANILLKKTCRIRPSRINSY